MKRIAFGFFAFFVASLLFTACQENVYMDWKLMNDRFNASLEDSMKYYASTKYTSLPDSVKKLRPAMQRDSDKTTGDYFYYKYIVQGSKSGRQPKPSSDVIVKYKGSLVDGSIFEYSYSTAQFTLSGTISGWKDIFPKMHTGDSIILYVPAKLAYDTVTTMTKIPPHSLLKFSIRLIDSAY